MLKDSKYLLANIVPALVWAGLTWGGYWAWASIIFVFGIVPFIEQMITRSTENHAASTEDSRSKRVLFDALLWLNVPIVYFTVGWFLFFLTEKSATTSWLELVGLTLGTGVVCGSNGINVAHELGHRNTRTEQFLSKILLLPSLYLHFFIEHNRGHHKHVATEHDPASAFFGENLYAFWVRSVSGSWISAWKIQAEDLKKNGYSFFTFKNEMLVFQVIQASLLGTIFYFLGIKGLLGFLAVAIGGFLLLETVNYIEHYGLRRKKLENGRFEPVLPQHSWNSNHEIGRILLYELTRHSDHHYKSTRKYQVLRHHDESPQLPFGYPGSMLLSLIPPIWYRVMHPKLEILAQEMEQKS
jgi:alkane 1-monooxygenase